jgi:putative inorganic carbon (HCO3(-)) transporter
VRKESLMGSLLLFIASLGGILAGFRNYYIPFLFFLWFDLVKPHTITWGWFNSFQYSNIFFIVGVLGWLFQKKNIILKFNFTYLCFLLFIPHVAFAYYLSDLPRELTYWKFDMAIKVLAYTFFMTLMTNSREKIEALMCTFLVSLLFYYVNKLWKVISSGGGGYNAFSLSYGQGVLAETSTMTIALFIGCAFLFYLKKHSILVDEKLKKILQVIFPFYCLFSIVILIGVQARTGLVVLVAAVFYAFLKFKKKLQVLFLLVPVVILGLSFAPQSWVERMGTIVNYEGESSAEGRINAWKFAIEKARQNPFFGSGYGVFRKNYDGRRYYEAHSIYFEVLGEQGYLGLLYYLGMLFGAYYLCHKTRKLIQGRDELIWLSELCVVNQFALFCFYVGGAFLGLSRHVLFYIMFTISLACYGLARKYVQKRIKNDYVNLSRKLNA